MPRKRRRRGPALPVRVYPPGYFTEPVLSWWPDWKPLTLGQEPGDAARSAAAALVREAQFARGNTGTVLMPNTPKFQARPAWMPRYPGRA